MAAQKLGQRWGGLPQLPAVTSLLVALVPVAGSGGGGLIGGAHGSSLDQALVAADTPDLNAASVEINECIAIKRKSMATLTIGNLDDNTKAQLRLQAARHGRSMEEEARAILRQAVAGAPPQPATAGVGHRIQARFARLGGLVLDIPVRSDQPDAPDFSELAR